MTEIILHHYDRSPYSEKVRLLFGYKGLAWRSVMVPMIMPKPALVALTGGYRRAPVMQIGADVYCDSALILDEIERRFPAPPLPAAPLAHAWGSIVGAWADGYLFWKVGRYVTGVNADRLPEAFVRDRSAMMRVPVDPARAKADLPETRAQLDVALGWIEAGLARAPFVGGEVLAAADLALYTSAWFLTQGAGFRMEAEHPRIAAWMTRVAAVGHGARDEVSAAYAIEAARAASPIAPAGREARASNAANEPGSASETARESGPIAAGDLVTVTPESFGTESVRGVVSAISAERITLHREHDGAPIAVHFPRFGYVVQRATA